MADASIRWCWGGLAVCLPGLALFSPRAEARPDDGDGLFTYDSTDVLEYWDVPDANIRVHFSVEGPNATILDDLDEDGVPDFAATIGRECTSVLAFYEAEGFRRPLSEDEVGLVPLGGSNALDVYLVDFGGSSDGQFSPDGCLGGVCAGHLLIENDFQGYGYPSLDVAARVLASHELFHGVQYAYTVDLGTWFSEGTATWAEHLYEPEVRDYLGFSLAYLADIGRSIDSPPAGSVTAFSYGTALFFGFVQEVLDASVMVEMLERIGASEAGSELDAVQDAITAAGGDFADLWVTFMSWNLATGPRSGLTDSYPYADALWPGVGAEVEGTAITDENRFYPVAATYYKLDHGGGELFLGIGEDNLETLVFRVHPTASAGKVLDPILTWDPDEQSIVSLGEQDPGTYWLIGTYPEAANESERRDFCFGDATAMEACVADEVEDSGDPGDTSEDPSDGGADSGPEDEAGDVAATDGESTDKSGCSTLAPLAMGWAIWLPALATLRRRAA